MGNVLTNQGLANARYTEFENNQVLTADQLNQLFRYLDIQTRLTRTRSIGVGIVCGLEIGITDQHVIVLSKGTAITTDGDLLYVNNDLSFNQYVSFNDVNARYNYFLPADTTPIRLFQLTSDGPAAGAESLSGFEQATNTRLADYVGILYQEDYPNDTDLCTGTDCDNKGIDCVRALKVLLVHKNDAGELLKSIPRTNQDYFSLDNIDMPRVIVKPAISKLEELRGAFASALSVKDELKSKLQKAFELCKPLVEDDLDSADLVKEWHDLLEEHFKPGGLPAQYVYDFAKDLTYAYNEMRETLFNDNGFCCPPVELFPKHVLLGLIRTAVIKRPAPPGPILTIHNPSALAGSHIRFTPGELIRRFHPVHADLQYRHLFYESPVMNNKEDSIQRTRFCFKRIDAMIRNFKIPVAEELQTTDAIRILPGMTEDRPLGQRSIPFYYRYNRNMPINAYWNFDANVRKKEQDICYYYSSNYSGKNHLQYNLLPFSFFRIEGHIGFHYREVEAALNRIINEYNLPINLVTVQVERELRTIPDRKWWFPHVHLYEAITRNNFIDHLNQAELVHQNLKEATSDDADKVKIDLAITNFSKAREKVLSQKPLAAMDFNLAGFTEDVTDTIRSATEVKVQTQKFTFSNTAAPHDFLINTDVLHKTDLLKDLLDKQIVKKKEALFLGNFLKSNPGLEHAGGVVTGGTFVLVYTSNDGKVVADFMLPYASVDTDIVPDPPVIKPIPFPVRPKLELPKVFEKIPPYKKLFIEREQLIDDKLKGVDEKVKDVNIRFLQKMADIEDSRKIINDRAEGIDKKIDERFKLFDESKNNLDKKVGEIDLLYTRKITEFESKLDYQGKIFTNIANVIPVRGGVGGSKTGPVVVGGRNLIADVEVVKSLSKELEQPSLSATDRQTKEAQLNDITRRMTEAINQPGVSIDKEDEHVVKGILLDASEATDKITNPTIKAAASGNIKSIVKNIGRIIK